MKLLDQQYPEVYVEDVEGYARGVEEAAYDEWQREQQERAYWEYQERKARESLAELEQRALGRSGELELLHNRIAKWLVIPNEDRDVMEFALAVYKSHELPDADPIWGMIVGPSGGGKSELLRTFLGLPTSFHLSKPTPASLASGYRGKNGKNADPSLLPLMDGKIVIMPDFAPILSARPEVRNEILGMLREAFDGTIAVGKGNLGHIVYKSRFSMLVGSTSKIDTIEADANELGERFVKIRLRGQDGMKKARRAADNVPHAKNMREELHEAVESFLNSLPKFVGVENPDHAKDAIARIADFTAKARTHVARHWRSREVEHLPVPEEGGRLSVQLNKLAMALALIRGRTVVEKEDIETIQRVADDSLPPMRFKAIQELLLGPRSQAELGKKTAIPETSAKRLLEDLVLLNAVNPGQHAHSCFSRCSANHCNRGRDRRHPDDAIHESLFKVARRVNHRFRRWNRPPIMGSLIRRGCFPQVCLSTNRCFLKARGLPLGFEQRLDRVRTVFFREWHWKRESRGAHRLSLPSF
ncbi:MAG: hypothetical protein WBQ83_15635 [Candidatus Acidiferrales bacterium]